MERNKITISFLPKDNEVWDFIQQKKETCNISEYIKSLIQQDMTNRPLLVLDEEKILGGILQLLKNNELIIPNKNVKEEILLNDESRNTL